jgi:hypothetical protein
MNPGARLATPEATPLRSGPVDLDDLRRLTAAATPGPWGWRGYDDGAIELRAPQQGGVRIVTALRSEPCLVELDDGDLALTAQACEPCRNRAAEVARTGDGDLWDGYRCPKPENLGTVWLHEGHWPRLGQEVDQLVDRGLAHEHPLRKRPGCEEPRGGHRAAISQSRVALLAGGDQLVGGLPDPAAQPAGRS